MRGYPPDWAEKTMEVLRMTAQREAEAVSPGQRPLASVGDPDGDRRPGDLCVGGEDRTPRVGPWLLEAGFTAALTRRRAAPSGAPP